MDTLHELLIDEVKDIYSAETQLLKALPEMAKKALTESLQEAFSSHLDETKGQVERLKKIGELLETKLTGKTCKAMQGLIEEGKEVLEEEGQSAVIDAALIGAAQRVEHYEIAAYGTAKAMAEHLGLDDVAALLEETLEEESAADEKLTQISIDEVFPATDELDEEDDDAEDEDEEDDEEDAEDSEEEMSDNKAPAKRPSANRSRAFSNRLKRFQFTIPTSGLPHMFRRFIPSLRKQHLQSGVTRASVLIALCCVVMGCETQPANTATTTPPTNSGVNARDQDSSAKTPIDQNENSKDIQITADIRKQVVATEMSVNAHNVKIITQDGKVTLRGPVVSDDEKSQIEKIARAVAGDDKVDNQIDVSPK